MKLGTHYLYASMQKKTGTYFRNFDLVNFWQFFELLHLDLVSGAFIVAKSSNSD